MAELGGGMWRVEGRVVEGEMTSDVAHVGHGRLAPGVVGTNDEAMIMLWQSWLGANREYPSQLGERLMLFNHHVMPVLVTAKLHKHVTKHLRNSGTSIERHFRHGDH